MALVHDFYSLFDSCLNTRRKNGYFFKLLKWLFCPVFLFHQQIKLYIISWNTFDINPNHFISQLLLVNIETTGRRTRLINSVKMAHRGAVAFLTLKRLQATTELFIRILLDVNTSHYACTLMETNEYQRRHCNKWMDIYHFLIMIVIVGECFIWEIYYWNY